MLIQRGLAYLDIAGEEESVGSVLELTPNIRRVPFFMEEESKKKMGENNPPAINVAPNIKCPVIGFFGNEDQNPSPEDVNDYSRALTDGGVEHEFIRYDYAGHAFQSFNIEEKYSEDASEDAWSKVLDFFREKI